AEPVRDSEEMIHSTEPRLAASRRRQLCKAGAFGLPLNGVQLVSLVLVALLTPSELAAEPPQPAEWPCFGGSASRNMVNVVDIGLPEKWDLRLTKDGGDLLWKAKLGNRAFAGPVIAGGRVYVGTNNERPRNPRDRDPKNAEPLDKGILM